MPRYRSGDSWRETLRSVVAPCAVLRKYAFPFILTAIGACCAAGFIIVVRCVLRTLTVILCGRKEPARRKCHAQNCGEDYEP